MRLRNPFYWLTFLSALSFLASLLGPLPAARAQTQNPPARVQAMLDAMSPEERIGQLFLVTFQGTDTHDQTQIYDLIANHHVGGVVLLAQNDNFTTDPDIISTTHQLINNLQTIALNAGSSSSEDKPVDQVHIPLFIGISQEGNGVPNDQILSGLTPMPDEMAIGATWKTELAKQVGSVMGNELSALGFNLYLGPSLDVVDSPNPSPQIDLGTRVFGGDPFWVGQMGRAYISGLHQGSDGRMVVVAKHFPGGGSSDRPPEDEVATVRKSLEQLKLIELSPFFAVTDSMAPDELADGLLVSHIRYQGFQGNIRATTRPVSLDASALSVILQLPDFTAWRGNGGLMVSDALGSQAVRDFYSQSGQDFSPRSVALDAFRAGNDLLYLGNITSGELNDDTYSATLRILDFFVQEYRTDSSFAQLVDTSVTRILAQKFRMYDTFSTASVLTPTSALEKIGTSQSVMFGVARNAATLINPDPQELSTLLPAPPNQADRIVFLTDTATYQQCTLCPPQDTLAADALEKAVLRLYGPDGSGQVFTNRLSYYPFSEVEAMLNGESVSNIESSLQSANWVVISLADISNGQVALLRRFFSERSNLVRNKNVILFSFTAPYYLDPTDISKLTAYYALYSRQPAFVEVAARLLFQQLSAQGYSPISIPAVNYDLIEATSPDPTQVIPLSLDNVTDVAPTTTATIDVTTPTVVPTETQIPLYRIGDTIAVRAGPIMDYNHHIVPDATVVHFTMSKRDEAGSVLQFVDATTVEGIAHASFSIDQPGKVEISAASELANVSEVIQFDASNEGAAVTVVVPEPTDTPQPILPTATVPVQNDLVSPEGYPRIGVWLLVLLALFGGALLMFWAVSRLVTLRWGLRWALCIFLGGLLAYNYLALGFPGVTDWIASDAGAVGVLLLTLIGEVMGALVAWIWMQVFSGPKSQED